MSRSTRMAVAVCALAAAFLLGLAGPAAAGPAKARQAGPTAPVSVAITSISPQVAVPGGTVRVSGQLTNVSSAAISGLSVQLRWSSQWLQDRDELQMYADGQIFDAPVPGTIRQIRSLAPGATAAWSVAVPVKELQLTRFGVYPFAAAADGAGGIPPATSRTFLPYWPAKRAGDPRPDRLNVSWILPLIDTPSQTACRGLLNNSLATSVAAGGRLNGLLAAGAANTGRAAVTWAIDPALLSSVRTMSGSSGYDVGGNADCGQSRHLPSSKAAAAWLARLKQAAAGQPVFVTPYADVDIATLTRQSLEQDLSEAFGLGRSTAAGILHRSFRPAAAGLASAQDLNGFAWPADGIANYAVLENLAVNGISTVILADSTMPPQVPSAFTPSAVASTPDGETGDMHVLLSDSGITHILNSADSPAQTPGAVFAVRQRFLAETAMIAAEAPTTPRSIVVAPPRRWDPPAGLAGSLLAETAEAPWLRPVPLSRLATVTSSAGQVQRSAPTASSSAALGNRLLRSIRTVDRQVQLLAGIDAPDTALYEAIASAESSAWRGRTAGARAQALIDRISAYVTRQLGGLSIIPSPRITLGGLQGTVPISIRSRLNYPVNVRLTVNPTHGRLTISRTPGVITVLPGKVITIKLKVRAATIGSTGVGLGLTTLDGTPLPGPTARMTIQATHFGTLALVIVAAALGVFMISSATRAIRRGREAPENPAGGGPGPASAESAQPRRADSVVSGPAGQREPDGEAAAAQRDDTPRPGPGWHDSAGDREAAAEYHPTTEETDDYARAPGWSDRG
jgi:hypothetical protein